MNKHLLFLAGAMLSFSSMDAQYATQTKTYTNCCLSAMSPNGKYAAGADPIACSEIYYINLEKGTKKSLSVDKIKNAEELSLGIGANAISNDGIVLISTLTYGDAAYFDIEKNTVGYLPVPGNITTSLCNAITPDGSRIAGCIGNTTSGLMLRPVIWNRNADGTYSKPVELPYPKKDFSGRTPQYILVNGISADGKTLACGIVDYFGELCQPMVLKEDAKGKWSYTKMGEELINPNNLQFPEYPGEAPAVEDYMTAEDILAYNQAVEEANNLVQPMPTDFMTPENRAAYEKAAFGIGNIVNYRDYMSDEEYAAYDKALDEYYYKLYPKMKDYMSEESLAAYMEVYNKWEQDYNVFDDVLKQIMETGVWFPMNNCSISQNGKYYTAAGAMNEDSYKAYIFDIETGEVTVKGVDDGNVIPVFIADDGRVLGAKPINMADMSGATYIAPGIDEDFVAIQDLVEEKIPATYNWMKTQMLHRMWVWDNELQDDVQKDVWVTGTPCCDANMKTIASWNIDSWENMPSTIKSYVVPMGDITVTAINTVAPSEPLAAKMANDGTIKVSGKATEISVYDMNGRLVFSATNPGTTIKTNLSRGSYVIMVANGDSRTVTKALR